MFSLVELIRRMREFEKLGIKSTDALHISSAVQANSSYFITVDKGILNKKNLIRDIKICNPIEFIEEQE
ncbi:MAG: hypothetical protein ABUK01_18305 [Leptospirales bacterium]